MASNSDVVPREHDDETGKFREVYPMDEFLDALDAEGGMAATREVADRVGCSYQLAHRRLSQLEDDGDIASRKVANARLWMLPDEIE